MIARPAYAAADTAALRHADFRDFTAMVRGSAKLRDRILIARGLEPIGMPHINDNVKRGASRHREARHHCATCGAGLCDRPTKTGLCIDCYKVKRLAEAKRCACCDTLLGKNNRSGRCADHRTGLLAAEPNELVRAMVRKAAKMFGVSAEAIMSRSHHCPAVEARCVVASALRRRGQSLPLIGRRLGRDHSSIKHLIDNLPKYAARNPLVATALEELA